MALSRNLFRVSAVVAEPSLHSVLLLLARSKAMNVETFPIDPEGAEIDQPPTAQRSGPGKPGRPSIRDMILTQLGIHGEMNLDAMRAAIPQAKPQSIDQSMHVLNKEGRVTRVATGTYRLTSNQPAHTNGGTAPAPVLQPSKTGTRTKPSEFILGLFMNAPDNTVRRADIMKAVEAAGGKSTSVTGVIERLMRDKKIKRASEGVYQLRT